MIFNRPHQLTKIEIWFPRYKDKHGELAEPVVLLAKYKVDQASPWIIIDFTKAHHLKGQRYCIRRTHAQSFPLDSNTKIPCYAVPLSQLENWDTAEEVREIVNKIF